MKETMEHVDANSSGRKESFAFIHKTFSSIFRLEFRLVVSHFKAFLRKKKHNYGIGRFLGFGIG